MTQFPNKRALSRRAGLALATLVATVTLLATCGVDEAEAAMPHLVQAKQGAVVAQTVAPAIDASQISQAAPAQAKATTSDNADASQATERSTLFQPAAARPSAPSFLFATSGRRF